MWHLEYYAAEGNDKMFHFPATWMELDEIMLSEMSQKKDKDHMVWLTVEFYSAMWKDKNHAICYYVDETEGNHAEWCGA